MTAKAPGRAERSPVRSRAVVPEFPAWRIPCGSWNAPPLEIFTLPSFLEIEHPSCDRHRRVLAQSAPGEKFSTFIPREERAPRKAALWEMDLSPGGTMVPEMLLPDLNVSIQTTFAYLRTPSRAHILPLSSSWEGSAGRSRSICPIRLEKSAQERDWAPSQRAS
jgi:hypothetical protein